ncbi:MAG: nodulation protein NfeD [Tissierellia bacterium]|nr:nodulation protein NfeD [Tissierellia bacterium]
MRRLVFIAILILVIVLSQLVFAENPGDVYVLPIKGEINRATYNFINSTLNKVLENNPAAIIFEIDTYGGLIVETEKIKNLIMALDIPTISFVNNKAESAGVLLAISSEKLVMAISSTIGSAETIPNTEKVLSMWRSFLRDAAQQRGRDPEIIEAMADSDIHIEGISERGSLLNLTGKEALELGVADLISDNYEDILNNFKISYNSIVQVDESLELKIAKILASSYISTLLITIGLIGFVIELFTPGFGIGGIISIISFGLFFAGNIMVGNSQMTSLIIFIIGLILLVIEAISPGFGLPGISGIVLIVVGIVLAIGSIQSAIMSLSVAIILTAIITILLIKQGHKIEAFNKIVLSTKQEDEEGYLSSPPKYEYLDKEGIALTDLRPSGVIVIGEEKLDALSEGSYIQKGSQIKVVKVEGSKIIVRRL